MKHYQCNSCHRYSNELQKRWFVFATVADTDYYNLCPKCIAKSNFFKTQEEAEASLITNRILNEY